MKLGILCTMINGFGRKGFYNTQEIGLGRALVARGHQVEIWKCLKQDGGQKEETLVLEKGLTVHYLPIKGLGAHGYLHSRVLAKDLDGLLCFGDNQVFLPHIARFCKKHGIWFVPYVGTTFSLHHGLHGKIMDWWFAAGTLKLYKSRPVIAKTMVAKKELENLGVTDINIGPVGLDQAVLRKNFRTADREELRKKYGFQKTDRVLCNVSRLEPEKRTLELVEMIARIRNKQPVKLLLVGEGSLREELDRKIIACGVSEEVLVLPRVPYEDMWEIYTLSDYFVNMNQTEIFGMAIMEAVYYETSVAAVDAPGPRLTLKNMPGHKLCMSDQEVEDWVTGELPEKEELHESSQRMLREFGWNRCGELFERIVRENRRTS